MVEQETRTIHRANLAVAPLAVVLHANCPATPKAFNLSSGLAIVGSGSRCNLVLDDPTVSRTHVQLRLVPEGVEVQDLGSRNGTMYLGQRITRATLAPGTRIQLGKVTLGIDLDVSALSKEALPRSTSFRGIVGGSSAMQRLFTTISRLDGSLVSVLVHGESGVGKELVARAIHEGSRVSAGPYVPVNCGAIPRDLVASTLFGHRRGAFTGAVDARQGAFASAEGGTLLLDEIGELPLEVQPALLRILETGEITPVGEDRPRPASPAGRARVIASTHRDLAELVRKGQFREDLFYRLAVVTLDVPPLRERREDIPLLARLFARAEGAIELDDEVIDELQQRPLPGNVRELRNAVLSYVALGSLAPASTRSLAPPSSTGTGGSSGVIGAGSEGLAPIRFDAPYLEQRDAMVHAFTVRYVTELLEQTKGNQSEAARIAGLDRTYLGRLISKLGLGRKGPG
jgi:DNA-binding NtrC family response regulator